MKRLRERKIEMNSFMQILPVLTLTMLAFVLLLAAPETRAGGIYWKVELDEKEIFFEENRTDGDLGLQIALDGKAWERIKIYDPHWRMLFNVEVKGSAKKIGWTEVKGEGAEPPYIIEDGNLPKFTRNEILNLFKPGIYKFFGRTVDGKLLWGKTLLTRHVPCAPVIDVDAEFEGDGTLSALSVTWVDVVTAVDPAWNPTTEEELEDDQLCLPEAPVGFKIIGHEAVWEAEGEDEEGEELVLVNTATLPASANSFTASQEFVDAVNELILDDRLDELKIEVIATEGSGNRAISEEEVEMDEE